MSRLYHEYALLCYEWGRVDTSSNAFNPAKKVPSPSFLSKTHRAGAQRVLFTCLGPKGLMVYFENIGVVLFKKWFLTRRNDDNEP